MYISKKANMLHFFAVAALQSDSYGVVKHRQAAAARPGGRFG